MEDVLEHGLSGDLYHCGFLHKRCEGVGQLKLEPLSRELTGAGDPRAVLSTFRTRDGSNAEDNCLFS